MSVADIRKNRYAILVCGILGALTLGVDDAELERRRAAWQPPAPKHDHGVLAKYAKLVSSADKGAYVS